MTGRRKLLLGLSGLVVVAGLIAAAVWLLRSPDPVVQGPGAPKGKWHPLRGHRPAGRTAEQARLETLPYLSGYKPAPEMRGVTVYKRGQAHDGYNLIFSGHGTEVTLMDMEGRVVHRWSMSYAEARRREPALPRPVPGPPWSFRRGYLYRDGHLLAIYGGFGVIKLDRDSRLVWAFNKPAHHDLFVDPEGQIHVLTRRARVVKRINETEPVLLDYLSVLSPDGQLVRETALLEAFERSEHRRFLEPMKRKGDIFHTNTVEVLDGRHAERSPVFSRGNVLISVRQLDVVAILDPDQRKIVWAASRGWRRQHDPLLLESGNMLVFDNLGDGGKSRVIEFDPLTGEVAWTYDNREGRVLSTDECGAVHRLPNGNTLIVESLNGRAIEVTRDKRIVWEYYNPHRAGAQGKLIATLFDVIRIDPVYLESWLGSVQK